MTKAELLHKFAEFEDFESKAQAERAFNHLMSTIKDELKAGNEVALGQDFGTFKVTKQAANEGITMGTPWKSPAKNVVKFKISSPFKAAVA